MALELKVPSLELLPGFVDALERGWSPDNIAREKIIASTLERIAKDAGAFVASLDDVDGKGEGIELPDGTRVPRLPGYYRWLWDGAFCGSIGFRWQPGTSALPGHVFGHVGYAVVPWKRNLGYASEAVRLLLPDCRARGLQYVELTTDPDNLASQRVITHNGGVLIEEFEMPKAYGEGTKVRYRIVL